jgi:hypothetical protein
MPRQEGRVTDDEWVRLGARGRDFALRWAAMSDDARDEFCRQLLVAIEVLEQLGVVGSADRAADDATGGAPRSASDRR